MLKTKKGLWVVIAIYISFIYLSLPFMRSFLSFLYKILGVETLRFGLNSLLIVVGVSFILYAFISDNGDKKQMRLTLIMIVLLILGLSAARLSIPEERIHFLEYGLLGYLILKAGIDSWKLPVISSFILVSIFGLGDEIIQWFLPDRVGETRDVLLNSYAGLLGISLMRLRDGKI